jgi:NTP pyrophosphatase (non-canonical NTP hydrolase)
MQGLVGDTGDLMKLIMAKEGIRDTDNVDKKIAHELADCLWCILVLAKKYDIDIEKSFLDTMFELEKKIDASTN